ncbi:hypothetical protein F1559_004191 [Cyanidiococcus yangmingshanensis]|uniref:Uncharacterized protein n=1 Tax=Cyanidiococcus yangmingshanensis TaxID=2690220 RepID=A0A7J7IN57_9RHOD|nr:hypothetical protein F1559_004191 [Cyanidiococcus yangmingshanensis]
MSTASRKKFFEDMAGGSGKSAGVGVSSSTTTPAGESERSTVSASGVAADRVGSGASKPADVTGRVPQVPVDTSARNAAANGYVDTKATLRSVESERKTVLAETAPTSTKPATAATPVTAESSKPVSKTATEGATTETSRATEATPAVTSTTKESSSKRLMTISEKAYELWKSGNSQDSQKNWDDAIYALACQRAHEIWLETGREDSEANFHQAREEVIANGGLYV